jgi:hypothetical protein
MCRTHALHGLTAYYTEMKTALDHTRRGADISGRDTRLTKQKEQGEMFALLSRS